MTSCWPSVSPQTTPNDSPEAASCSFRDDVIGRSIPRQAAKNFECKPLQLCVAAIFDWFITIFQRCMELCPTQFRSFAAQGSLRTTYKWANFRLKAKRYDNALPLKSILRSLEIIVAYHGQSRVGARLFWSKFLLPFVFGTLSKY